MFELVYNILEEAIKDSILYGAPLPIKVESNLVTVKTQGGVVNLDFQNGKIENVWLNKVNISTTVKQKYQLTLLAS